MVDHFHKNFGVIFAFLAALFALLFFWTYQVYSLNAPSQWIELDKRFDDTGANTERLLSLSGFHGLKHNFSDYLITGKPASKERFFDYFDEARDVLDKLHAHFGAAADAQVNTIDETLRGYFVSINRIDQLRGEGKSIREIDNTIHIDDAAAFAAYQDIIDMYDAEQNNIRTAVLAAMEKDQSNLNSLYTTLFAIGLLLAIVVVMGLRFEYLKRKAVARQSEIKSVLESFLDYATVPFLIAGADGIVRHCNQAAARLLQTQPKNLVGASLTQILEFDSPMTVADIYRQAGTDRRISATLNLQSGMAIPVQADFSTNKDDTMQIVALFDRRSEIGARQRILLEAEQKLANVTIDGSLSVRRDIQKFIDLIHSFAAEVKDNGTDYAERAEAIARTMKTHVADYLALSAPPADSLASLNAPVTRKLQKTVAETLGHFDTAISEKNLTFTWVNRVPLPREIDFPAQLQRIISNLLSNAINYTNNGGAIKVSTTLETGDLLVKVEDTGIGIAEEDIERIFERGFRHAKAAGMSGGLGIGLYTVRETVNKLGGEITCTSYAGIGSDFVVRIPLAQVQPGMSTARSA
ncbi:ATP-binding protein [Sneathiella sp.]|uniref:ATP-binding protein n=1 Tax=Sneathiella sp. TaxID=1964365 RepID=UPI0035657E80